MAAAVSIETSITHLPNYTASIPEDPKYIKTAIL